jgi:endoglucanase
MIMRNIKTLIITLLVSSVIVTGCGNTTGGRNLAGKTEATDIILVNQVGYAPASSKIALVRADAVKFEILDAQSGKIVFEGKTGDAKEWKYSGDKVSTADFTSLQTPGKYKLYLPHQNISSFEFAIGEGLYNNLTKASAKAFYFNRCSYAITPEYGSKWARPAGHPDTDVFIHESAASKERPAGTKISSPGGWYDAGDYGKYIVNSGITVYTLLLFYQMYPAYCEKLSLNIPESNNNIPDIVDELLYNLKWMLTMQDPTDGGVYHKLTSKNFDSFEMPDKDTLRRYIVLKSTAATLDFAAVTAMAARVFENDPHPELAALSSTCRKASEKAMKWAERNPDIIFHNPKDIHTGEYGDDRLSDEWFWAKTETALVNGNPSAITIKDISSLRPKTPGWERVEMLGLYSLALSNNPEFSELKKAASASIASAADVLMEEYAKAAYQVSLDTIGWGSNGEVVNEAMEKIIAMQLTGDKKYLPSIQADADYILGRNATGYCFVTGIGSKSPMNLHSRISGSDGIPEPVPGFLVGGPNIIVLEDCKPHVERSIYPAKSYTDSECSYSTNEIAINWNAPLFFVAGFLDQK